MYHLPTCKGRKRKTNVRKRKKEATLHFAYITNAYWHHHDPTCVSSTGAVVRGGLAFGHAVLSGVVQVGDNCREVSVTTATHKIHTHKHT